MAHNGRMSKREAFIHSVKATGKNQFSATHDGVKFIIWQGTISTGTFWTVNVMGEAFRINTPTQSGPGFGGSYPTKGQAFNAIVTGAAVDFAHKHAMRLN